MVFGDEFVGGGVVAKLSGVAFIGTVFKGPITPWCAPGGALGSLSDEKCNRTALSDGLWRIRHRYPNNH